MIRPITVALVIIAHSDTLARGVVELATQMAPDVQLIPCGGTDDKLIGTSFSRLCSAISSALEELPATGQVVLTADLGSAVMTAEAVLELLDDDRVILANGPLVEGTVAGAVAAQQGCDGGEVIAAVMAAGDSFFRYRDSAEIAASDFEDDDSAVMAEAVIADRVGLHARPAALLARKASEYEAEITLDGADATSVLELMSLGIRHGQTVKLRATGIAAELAIKELSEAISQGLIP